jgi:hypothetical protein
MQGSGSDCGALLSWVEMSQVQQRGGSTDRLRFRHHRRTCRMRGASGMGL